MTTYFWVALGGAVGASARYAVGVQTLRMFGPGFPWGTLGVNIVGSFLMGVLVELMALKFNVSQEIRAFLTIGVLGGFTTFSAFSLETVLMIERNDYVSVAIYIFASVVLSIMALFAALWGVRAVLI